MVALPGFLTKLFDANARDIARYQQTVAKINALESKIAAMTDEQLRAKTEELRTKVQTEYQEKRAAAEPTWAQLTDQQRRDADRRIFDPILDSVLPEAFAMVREASKRTLGLRHYDVQLIGGMVLHDGRIAEMRTGEGKTLVATCPLFLNALLGRGAHLVTSNDYLSKRDAVWNGPIYHLLGMSVGIIQGQSPETGDEGGTFIYDPDYDDPDPRFTYARPAVNRQEAYGCDITYGTNNEYGFDYLRDNMEFSKDELRQRDLFFAIVDEVDSILIDEARTPLIISGMVEQSTDKYYIIDSVVAKMRKGIDDPKKDKDNPNADKLNPNIHYVVDEKAKTATITDAGVDFVERELGIDNLSENRELMHYLQASLKAHGVFKKDIDYVIKTVKPEDGPEIIIVDESTGRLMFGRRYSDGLHQAIEAKEHVEVKNESQTLATITFQNYFRIYSKLGGMTGTAKTEEDEFRKIYALDVVQVPTNKPIKRKDHADVIYKTEEQKLRGIIGDLLRVYCKEQPILVGTRSIQMSERVSKRLDPSMLVLRCLIEVAHEKLELSKSVDAVKKREYVALLNTPMEPYVRFEGEEGKEQARRFPALALTNIRPVLKELGISDKVADPTTLADIMRLFEIEESGKELLLDAFKHGIPHNILNAKFHEKEAVIIAEAGRKGAVTIATNMAGRGVDILLGGKHINQELPTVDGSVKSLDRVEQVVGELSDEEGGEDAETEAAEESNYRRFGRAGVLDAVTTGALTDEDHKKAAEEVRGLGGLFILGTERHESRRIDNQLRGRAGRQGDPGESRFFVSLEDELWRLFGDRANHPLLKTWDEHLAMDARLLSGMIQNAQKKVESYYFESRKNVLNYDDVMNRQRELIYRERRSILEGADLRETILHYIRENIRQAVRIATPDSQPLSTWNVEELYRELDDLFALDPVLTVDDLKEKVPGSFSDGKSGGSPGADPQKAKAREDLTKFLTDHVLNVYESREQEMEEIEPGQMREMERWMALRAINDRWMEHLANMDYLREGIGLRGYEQKDPLLIYQKEAFDEFERMQQAIQDDIIRNLFRYHMASPQQVDPEALELLGNIAAAIPLPSNLLKSLQPDEEPQEDGHVLLSTEGLSMGRGQSVDALLSNVKKLSAEKTADGKKIGRNDPCWCGSGKKFKHCHAQV